MAPMTNKTGNFLAGMESKPEIQFHAVTLPPPLAVHSSWSRALRRMLTLISRSRAQPEHLTRYPNTSYTFPAKEVNLISTSTLQQPERIGTIKAQDYLAPLIVSDTTASYKILSYYWDDENASHLSPEKTTSISKPAIDYERNLESHSLAPANMLHVCGGEFLKGLDSESVKITHSQRKTDKLFDRDYGWVLAQTMASVELLTLRATYIMLTYRAYRRGWG